MNIELHKYQNKKKYYVYLYEINIVFNIIEMHEHDHYLVKRPSNSFREVLCLTLDTDKSNLCSS